MWNGFDKFCDFMEAGGKPNGLRGEVIGSDLIELKTQSVTIDTCFCNDVGAYETAIITVDNIYIMERYQDKVSAVAAHKRWVSMAEKNKMLSFVDAQDYVVRVIE